MDRLSVGRRRNVRLAELKDYFARMGMKLPAAEIGRIAWLIHHHLDIRPLINRMGAEGDSALLKFAEEAGDPSLVRALLLFTYADRVAVYLDSNKNSHDAMVLGQMLTALSGSTKRKLRKGALRKG